MSGLLTAAVQYAQAGWPVFPCHWVADGGGCSCGWSQCPNASKHPQYRNPHPKGSPERATCRGECGKAGHGLHDATTNLDTILGWWGRWPQANIGVATGAPGPDVVDFDTKKGAPGRRTYERLRDLGLLAGAFAVVATPSGGWHLYYAGTDQGNGAIARHGVDFRATGGYVLGPPSVTAKGQYQLVERRDWTGVAVDWQAIKVRLNPPRPPRVTGPRLGGRGDHSALVQWVARQPEGGRNNALYWAACRALETGGGRDVLADLTAAAVNAGLDQREAERTVESAERKTAGR